MTAILFGGGKTLAQVVTVRKGGIAGKKLGSEL